MQNLWSSALSGGAVAIGAGGCCWNTVWLTAGFPGFLTETTATEMEIIIAAKMIMNSPGLS